MIDEAEVRQALVEVVEEFGRDHRAPRLPSDDDSPEYTSCRYVIDNQPSCIAAQVCFRLGLAGVFEMERWEGDSVDTHLSEGITGGAVNLLCTAQRIQDGVDHRAQLSADAPEGNEWGLVLDLLDIH